MTPSIESSRQRLAKLRKQGALPRSGAGVTGNEAKPARSRSARVLFVEFFRLLRGHRLALVLALLTAAVSTGLKLIPPAATKLAIDYVLIERPLPENFSLPFNLSTDRRNLLLLIALGVVAVSLLDTMVHIWGRYQATRITKLMQMQVRRKVFQHAIRLPLHRVYELKSGGAASVLREDAGGVAELIFAMFYNPTRAIVQLVGSMVILMWVDWRLLLGSLVLIPCIYFTHRTWIGRIRPVWRLIRKQRQEIDSQATESFGGMRVVRAFGRQRAETLRFMRGNHLMARLELVAWWASRGIEIVWEVLIPVASAALLWYGGTRVLDGAITIGDLMMFLVYLAMLLTPMAVLANSATTFQNSLAALDRILDLLEEPTEMPLSKNVRNIDRNNVKGRMTLSDVCFHYPGSETTVLDSVSLEVNPGETVALVGPSGSGKTTLCNLIARFYDPTRGYIKLDDIDLRDLDVEKYRRLFGIVEQDIFLFDGTIRDNIAYGKRGATDEQIVHAAHLANAHEFIDNMPDRYDTVIGERGVRLSGGQRQRLALARAILADPRILILDEATSNLDSESERLIQISLSRLMKGRTSFVIAHRLSTIVNSDRIVVLENGRIVDAGPHAELMSRSERYREMVRVQVGSITELTAAPRS
ncbi:MAG TPA: ABC transporter ATP-binding protein [Phycisphaeraceae bacterium]|nr:ABC transporter ATP-binding protein [Phycisphaeraceae bacterium]